MEVVLLERIAKLGQMGDVVRVKTGYARNFLLPRKKALRATKENIARFEANRAQLEAHNLEQRKEAESIKAKLDGKAFVILRQAGESGQLYGSVNSRDIAQSVTEGGFTLTRTQIVLNNPIKTLGLHNVTVTLHPEVNSTITVNVARSEDEARRQAAGENVTLRSDAEDAAAEAKAAAEAFFESEELAKKIAGEDAAQGEEPAAS